MVSSIRGSRAILRCLHWQQQQYATRPASLPSIAKARGFATSSATCTLQPPSRPVASGNAQQTQPLQQRRRVSLAAALAIGVAGYGLALAFPPSLYRLLFPTPVAGAPSAESEEGRAYTARIEAQLQNLPLVQELRAQTLETAPPTSPNATSLSQDRTSKPRRYKETRPYSRLSLDKKKHSLTQYSLRGPGMFAVTPLVFSSLDDKECIGIMHVGESMCGHNGIVHGGLLATILDEAIARPAFYSLPNRVGMTAYLNVRYKVPTEADQFLVVRTRCTEVKGRKAWATGTIETLDGKVLVEADALYVEPKHAWILQTSAVKEAME